MKTIRKWKKIMQVTAIGAILLTLLIPAAIGTLSQNAEPKDEKMTEGVVSVINNLMTTSVPKDNEELLAPGVFNGNVRQWHINLTPPYEVWKIPMGQIEGAVSVGHSEGMEINYLSATWDSPFSSTPFRLQGTIIDGYITGQMLGVYPGDTEYIGKFSGFYRINEPSEHNPGDFYLQLLIRYWPGDFVVEGFYTSH